MRIVKTVGVNLYWYIPTGKTPMIFYHNIYQDLLRYEQITIDQHDAHI